MSKAIQWWWRWHGLDSPLGHAIPVFSIIVQGFIVTAIVIPPILWALKVTLGSWWGYWLW